MSNSPNRTFDNTHTLSRACLVREIGRFIRDANERNYDDEEDCGPWETFGTDINTVEMYMQDMNDEVVKWLAIYQQ